MISEYTPERSPQPPYPGKPLSCQSCPYSTLRRIAPVQGTTDTSRILILGEFPSLKSPHGGAPFSDRAGMIVRMLVGRLRQYYKQQLDGEQIWKPLEPVFCYAVQCTTDDRPPKKAIVACRTQLEAVILTLRPTIIVSLGAITLQSLFQRAPSFDTVRGTFIPYRQGEGVNQHTCEVMCTYSPRALLVKAGLYEGLYRDFHNAFARANGQHRVTLLTAEDFRRDYRFPHTVQEVRDTINYILNYSKPNSTPETHTISVDTETTSLEPHDPNAKMIAISFAWDIRQATTILLDHPQTPFSPEELVEVKKEVRRLLASSKPKVLHNDKFDRKFIVHRYGWELNRTVWDTLGGEHLIEEDKKGEYGLKTLTKERLPEYANYEGKIDELREAHGGGTRASEARKYRKALESYRLQQEAYIRVLPTYEKECAQYETQLKHWMTKRQEERILAKKERRKMDLGRVGPKLKKPKLLRAPKKPTEGEPFNYASIPLSDLELYAAVDADVTRQILWYQHTTMQQEYARDVARYNVHNETPTFQCVQHLMKQHVLPTSATLADMEFTGFPVDIPYVKELDEKLLEVMRQTEDALFKIAGRSFVIGNPAEVMRILFSDGFYHEGKKIILPMDKGLKRTPKGQLQADQAALLYIANTYKYDFPRKILTYRKAAKARTPFLTNVLDHAMFDGRVHSTFHLTGTATGRLSSSGENLQVCPKKLAGYNIKKIFIPPPGFVLINTDAKGAEIRIFASYAKDVRLSKAIQEGLDAHSFFTAEVYGLKYEEVEYAREVVDRVAAGTLSLDPEKIAYYEAIVKKRTNCKRVVFGVLYGAQAPKIAETAGISLQDAQAVINLMFRMFPSIPGYIHRTEQQVRRYLGVYTETNRKRRLPLAAQRAFQARSCRQAVNFRIQSTSSDVVLWVLNQIHPVIKHDMQGQFHATVHDSIVFSVPPKYLPQIKPLMDEYGTRRVAEAFPFLTVPFAWDVEAGNNYGEVGNIDEYLKGHPSIGEINDDHELITDHDLIAEFNSELALG